MTWQRQTEIFTFINIIHEFNNYKLTMQKVLTVHQAILHP